MTRCLLCKDHELTEHNASGVCAECRLTVHNLLNLRIEERWRPVELAGTDNVIVSDQGRVARLIPIDNSGHYPRVSLVGRRFYLHTLIARAFHGPRPRGQLVLHGDDIPTNATAGNLRYGTHRQNAEDRSRNRRRKATR